MEVQTGTWLPAPAGMCQALVPSLIPASWPLPAVCGKCQFESVPSVTRMSPAMTSPLGMCQRFPSSSVTSRSRPPPLCALRWNHW